MLKAEQVPPGLALIARRAFYEANGPTSDDDWNDAIAAALNAWPGMRVKAVLLADTVLLPLPTEKLK